MWWSPAWTTSPTTSSFPSSSSEAGAFWKVSTCWFSNVSNHLGSATPLHCWQDAGNADDLLTFFFFRDCNPVQEMQGVASSLQTDRNQPLPWWLNLHNLLLWKYIKDNDERGNVSCKIKTSTVAASASASASASFRDAESGNHACATFLPNCADFCALDMQRLCNC